MKHKRIYFYQDLKNDEFEAPPKNLKRIIGDYQYVPKTKYQRLGTWVVYCLIATPIAFVYTKLIRRIKFINRQVLKPYRHSGYFIFANHTHPQADAFSPHVVLFPKNNYTIVNASNVSLPIMGNVTKKLGALPLPEDLSSGKNFIRAIELRISQGHSILVYPEAHVWPYYTKIRPFDDNSFKYPAKLECPVFTFTTTYQKGCLGTLKTKIYVDGPFVCPDGLHLKARQAYLHQLVTTTMHARAQASNYQKIIYQPKESQWTLSMQETKTSSMVS